MAERIRHWCNNSLHKINVSGVFIASFVWENGGLNVKRISITAEFNDL